MLLFICGCNTLNDLPDRVCVPNKITDLKLHIFKKKITGIKESKHISCDCKWKFDGRKFNLN